MISEAVQAQRGGSCWSNSGLKVDMNRETRFPTPGICSNLTDFNIINWNCWQLVCHLVFSRRFWEVHHQSGHPKSCALSLHSARKGLLSSSMQWKSLWSELRCEHSQLSASGCSEGGWESGWESTQLQLAPTKGWWPVVGNPVKSLAKSLKSDQAGEEKGESVWT